MSVLRWSILFELVGFCLVSFSIFLRIGWVATIADKCKVKINEADNFFKNLTIIKLVRDADKLLSSEIPKRRRGMILRPIRTAFKDFPKYIFALIIMNNKFRELERLKKQHPGVEFVLGSSGSVKPIPEELLKEAPDDIKQMSRDMYAKLQAGDEESIRNLYKDMKWIMRQRLIVFVITVLIFWPIIFIVMPILKLLIFIFNLLERVITKLTEANVVTNISIVIGTILIIAGLALELFFTP